MEKGAATKDSKLKELKAEKKQWHLLARLIIAKIQAFRKAMGGKGNTKIHLPPFQNTEPYPQEYYVYLESISQDYLNMINKARHIMDLQNQFAMRKNKRTKRRNVMENISRKADSKIELVSESSWWGSRLFSNLALVKLNKHQRKIRLTMIKALADSERDIEDMETLLLSGDNDALADLVMKFLSFTRLFNRLVVLNASRLARFSNIEHELLNPPPEQEDSDSKKDKPKKPPKRKKQKKSVDKPLEKKDIKPEEEAEVYTEAPPDEVDTNHLSQKMIDLQQKMIAMSDNLSEHQYKVLRGLFGRIQSDLVNMPTTVEAVRRMENQIESFEDTLARYMVSIEERMAMMIDDDIYKLADNVLTRWIKRKLMSINPNRVQQLKLDVIEDLHQLDDKFNKLLNKLEDSDSKDFEIIYMVGSIANFIVNLNRKVFMLGNIYYDSNQRPKLKRTHLLNMRRLKWDIDG